MIITIGGDAGSGKSTVGRLVADKIGFKFYSVGGIMRQLAVAAGMKVEEFEHQAETHPQTDRQLDVAQQRIGRLQDNVVMEGRLSWKFVPHSFKVFLKVSDDVAAKRIFADHQAGKRGSENAFKTVKDALADVRSRRMSDLARYKKLYNVDPFDPKHYDLIVDTSNKSLTNVVDTILAEFRRRQLDALPHSRKS
jgi:cytidylate kinase